MSVEKCLFESIVDTSEFMPTATGQIKLLTTILVVLKWTFFVLIRHRVGQIGRF